MAAGGTNANSDEMLVCVQREWDGWRTTYVRLGDLQNIHWFQPQRAPRPLVHGYISCASMTGGAIPHTCEPTEGSHTLLVCILKKHSTPSVYAEVARRADAQRILVPHAHEYSDDDLGVHSEQHVPTEVRRPEVTR